MICQMQMVIRQTQSIGGGACESIFPAIEQWLQADSDNQNALQHVAGRKDMSRYESVVDFIVVELHPELRRPCASYYDEKGPQLREVITEQQRRRIEARSMRLLHLAYECFCEHRRMSWSGAVALVEKMAA